MADDPFADLDGAGTKRSAAERFEEEDRLNPEPDDPRRRRPEIRRPANRYAWVVGIVMLMGIGVLLLTTAIPNSGAGLEGPTPGAALPQFAAPAAYGSLNGDANVCKEGGKCGKGAGSVPACRVRSDQVVNSCELRKKPVVLTFLVTRGADCEPQVDRVERMRKEFPQVNFAAVVSGNDRAEVERIARRRGWTMPVAVDSDGAVVNLFGVGVCPTTVFARKGGRVRTTKLGNLTEDELRGQVRAVLAKR